jgi:Lrp/AsnC ligand binding domain
MLDAYILIQTPPAEAPAVAGLVRAVPGVSEAEVVLGPYNIIARAQARDTGKLAGLVTGRIQALSGVTRTMTCPVFQAHATRHERLMRGPLRAANGALAKRPRRRVNGAVTEGKARENGTARGYWAEPSALPYARAAAGNKRQDDPAHQWYRLPSQDSFKAGCSCGWLSPERGTFEQMSHDVDQHLDAARQPPAAPGPGAPSQQTGT